MIELNLNVEMHWDPTFEVGRHCLGYRTIEVQLQIAQKDFLTTLSKYIRLLTEV